MRVIVDIETNRLENPDKIWLVVCKDIDSGEYHIFRKVTDDAEEAQRFKELIGQCTQIIGHNILGYDVPVLCNLLGFVLGDLVPICTDTLILSKLVNYSRKGHSIEDYGIEFGLPKGDFSDWTQYSPEMEVYCVRDVDICERVYNSYLGIINDPNWAVSIQMEHQFQLVVNSLHDNGFGFDSLAGKRLLEKVNKELSKLDEAIHASFPKRLKLIREVHPTYTKHGTLHRKDFRWVAGGDLSEFNGGPFSRCQWTDFNPSSHRQIVDVLYSAGWKPVDRTQTAIRNARVNRKAQKALDNNKLVGYSKDNEEGKDESFSVERYGWKINETNLSTLPSSAPSPARQLARRILVESRRRTLVEWLNLICSEIKIEKESISVLGHAIKDQLILNGVPRNKSIIEKDIRKEILQSLEFLHCNRSVTTVKKNENDSIILNLPTELIWKTLIEWLKSRKVNVNFVRENEDFLWITITPPEKSEDCSVRDAILLLDGLKTKGLRFSFTSERIKGRFFSIGAWTHRMAHQAPNTANIPNSTDTQGKTKLYGAEMRSLWCAPPGRHLVGVDAEGIQLRIFAHYIDDPEFTKALIEGRKDDKTDPHSLNQRVLGRVCKSRAAAKRFIYALLLGAGTGKLSQVLECSEEQTKQALNRLLERYSGWAKLKKETIPVDAERGYFTGLDGRQVKIYGDTVPERQHLAMSGYLQNGEAVVMKHATLLWHKMLQDMHIEFKLVNFVHDEWQTECKEDLTTALMIAYVQADSLRLVGERFKLKCPLAGSYWNDDLKDYTIGKNWKVTH